MSQRTLNDEPETLYARLKSELADTDRIQGLISLSRYYLKKTARGKRDVDSSSILYTKANLLARKIRSAKWSAKCLELKGLFYILTDNYKQGRSCYLSVAANYRSRGDVLNEAQTWEDLGNAIPMEKAEWLNDKKRDFENAGLLFAGTGDKERQIETHKQIADVNLNEGNLDLAEKQLLQVLAEYKAINFKKLHHTYFLLSAVSRLRSDLKKELYYDLETKRSMLATADTADAVFFLVKLGDCYQDLGMYENSLANYKEALDKYHSSDDVVYSIIKRVVRAMISQKKAAAALDFLISFKKKYPASNTFEQSSMYMAFGDCYSALNRLPQANDAYHRMILLNDLNFRSKFLPVDYYVKCYQIICNYYIKTRQFKKAAASLAVLDGTRQKLVSAIHLAEIQFMHFQIDSASGSYLNAIRHYQSFKKINDSVFSAGKIKEVSELQIKFETEAKDKELQVKAKNILLQKKDIQLLVKQNQLQHFQVEKSRARGNLMAVIGVVLLLLLGVGYNRYRLKIKNNLELQRKQQEVSTKNGELEHLLNENQWLLREVHHRVKNNLQIVISLLNSQSAYLRDEIALNAVMESKLRVQAMSLIHQKLYGCENVSTIYMPEYIRDLVGHLKDTFKSGKNVFMDIDVAPLSLDVSQAVPVGLILNEAITNAFKYAFPYSGEDVLSVRLQNKMPSGVSLIISDNGRGLPQNIELNKVKSFGLKLIRGLTEDLGGKLTITGPPGTALTIDFEIFDLSPRTKSDRGQQRAPLTGRFENRTV